MAIEPINPIGAASDPAVVVSLAANHTPLPQSPAAHEALAEAKAKAAETLEQLATDGDPIAIAKLTQEEKQSIPLDAQHLLPANHPAGAHEAGKGDLIDVYD